MNGWGTFEEQLLEEELGPKSQLTTFRSVQAWVLVGVVLVPGQPVTSHSGKKTGGAATRILCQLRTPFFFFFPPQCQNSYRVARCDIVLHGRPVVKVRVMVVGWGGGIDVSTNSVFVSRVHDHKSDELWRQREGEGGVKERGRVDRAWVVGRWTCIILPASVSDTFVRVAL
ncbi:hypothetical protein Pmani_009549 [Petrolisthes manimaculis]|uniref:Uncharacterized protein n=1 Tax=Petrolisthes manimaculis TaxID=1843537 RepID=A0AAE1Q4P6_9EUCA|nr:hypothetical protein Pmani_009549 [Petrolisthes manimaculis]